VEGLPAIEGTFWPVGPGHLVGGYDAGYYGYLWSLVYGDDLWSRFAAEGIDNPAVGTAHRRDPGTGSDPGRGGTGGGVPGLAINGAGVPGPDGDRVHCD
jgi:hypothetical protein